MQFWDNCSTFAAEMGRLSKLISSSTLRNVAKLLSANVIAQVIGLVVYPILTRIYAPEDFGLLNLFVSIGSVLAILATAEYQYAIILPKKEEEARAVVHLNLLLLLLCTLVLVGTLPWADNIAALFNTPALAQYYGWIPLSVLLLGLWNILNYWYIRNKLYTRISAYQVSQSLLLAGSKLGFGYTGMLQGGLIYSMLVAPLCSIIVSVCMTFKQCIRPLFAVNGTLVRSVAKQYRNFPLFTMPRSFINVISGQLPVLLLVPIFGTEQVGLWGMALVLGFVPINMISKAIYQVLYRHITERVHTGKTIAHILNRFVVGSTLAVVPIFVGLYFVLPSLTAWFLGENWHASGEYVRWMLPWLYFSLVTGSTCFLADVFFKQKIGLYFEVLSAFFRIIGIALGIVFNNFLFAIAAYSIGTAIAVAAQLIWLMTLVRKYEKGLVQK